MLVNCVLQVYTFAKKKQIKEENLGVLWIWYLLSSMLMLLIGKHSYTVEYFNAVVNDVRFVVADANAVVIETKK